MGVKVTLQAFSDEAMQKFMQQYPVGPESSALSQPPPQLPRSHERWLVYPRIALAHLSQGLVVVDYTHPDAVHVNSSVRTHPSTLLAPLPAAEDRAHAAEHTVCDGASRPPTARGSGPAPLSCSSTARTKCRLSWGPPGATARSWRARLRPRSRMHSRAHTPCALRRAARARAAHGKPLLPRTHLPHRRAAGRREGGGHVRGDRPADGEAARGLPGAPRAEAPPPPRAVPARAALESPAFSRRARHRIAHPCPPAPHPPRCRARWRSWRRSFPTPLRGTP